MPKKKSSFFLFLILIFFGSGRLLCAQTFNKKALLELAEKEALIHQTKSKSFSGTYIDLSRRLPIIYESANLEAAQSVNNDQVWSGGIAGLSLSGSGQLIGHWDADQPRITHQEYSGRVTFEDSEAGANNAHATQMVGTMVATGVESDAKGMANLAVVEAWNWNSDIAEMATEAANGLLTSSHPYIETAGWTTNTAICDPSSTHPEIDWMWFSLESENTTKAYQFGYYDSQAQKWDSVAYLAPDYLMIKAAGNNRGEGPASQPVTHWKYDSELNCAQDSETIRELDGGTSGYESIDAASLAKNVLVVGAVESSTSNFDYLSSISPISSSGFGPTDDGRIKPDIVAPTNVYTSGFSADNAYSTGGGTSAATAVVAGSVALIREHYQNLNSDTLSSASLRALLAQTTDDVGNEGPDYKTGWGLLNTERAVRFLSANNFSPTSVILKDTLLSNGNSISVDFEHTSTRPLMITIAWTDPGGTPPVSGDDPSDIILVNDLDLLVSDPSSGLHQPWVLDKSNPDNLATTGDNVLDNIEQVYISNAESGTYSVSISHKENLQGGSQYVSILVSEAEPEIIFETIANGNWSDPSTWSGGVAPSTSLHRAKLNHSVTLDENAIVRGITFEGSSSELDLHTQVLSLYGGLYYTSGGLGFSGDSSSSLSILDWDSGSDSLRFKTDEEKLNTLLINSESDTIRLASQLDVFEKLSLRKGVFDVSSASLKLIADSTNTAWLEKEDGEISGDFTYSRMFNDVNSGWRMISSPLKSATYSVLNNNFYTQGGSWAEQTVEANQSSLWLFDEASQNFASYIGVDSTFTSGEGYLFYMFANEPGGASILPAALEISGEEPDSVLVNLTRGADDASSYNFVGNPFVGTLDWHELVSDGTNLGTSYTVWDPEGNTEGGTSGYTYYNSIDQIGNAGRYIAPMQGFFVQSADENAVLKFRQSQKAGIQPKYFGKDVPNKLPLFIKFELLNENETILDNQGHLVFSESANTGKDVHDVLRMKSLSGIENQISFLGIENEPRVFEGRSSLLEKDEVAVKLEVSESGFYTLNWKNQTNIPDNWELVFVDEETNKSIKMNKVSEYQFYQEEGSSKRFRILIQRGIHSGDEDENEEPTMYALSQNYPNPFNPATSISYSVNKSENVRIEVFNTLGQRVAVLVDEKKSAGKHVVQFNASRLSSGVYYYRIETGGFVQSRSMVLIK